MSVILLSDRSALGSSDEHCALDVSSGRRITPVELQAIPPKPSAESPRGSPQSNQSGSPPSGDIPWGEAQPELPPEVPASGYLPVSG